MNRNEQFGKEEKTHAPKGLQLQRSQKNESLLSWRQGRGRIYETEKKVVNLGTKEGLEFEKSGGEPVGGGEGGGGDIRQGQKLKEGQEELGANIGHRGKNLLRENGGKGKDGRRSGV